MEKSKFKWQMWHVHLLAVSVVFITLTIWFNYYKQIWKIRINESNYSVVGKGQGIKEAVFIDDGKAVALSLTYHSDSEGNEYEPLITKSHIVLSDYRLYNSPDKTGVKDEYYFLRVYSTKKAKLGREESIDLLKLIKEAGYSDFKEIGEGSYVDGGDDVLPLVLKNDKEIYLNLNQKTISSQKPKQSFDPGYEAKFLNMLNLTEEAIGSKNKETVTLENFDAAFDSAYERIKYFDEIFIGDEVIYLNTKSNISPSEADEQVDIKFYGPSEEKVVAILRNGGRIYNLQEKMSLEDYVESYRWFDPEARPYWYISKEDSKDGDPHFVENYQEFLQWIKEEKLNEKTNQD